MNTKTFKKNSWFEPYQKGVYHPHYKKFHYKKLYNQWKKGLISDDEWYAIVDYITANRTTKTTTSDNTVNTIYSSNDTSEHPLTVPIPWDVNSINLKLVYSENEDEKTTEQICQLSQFDRKHNPDKTSVDFDVIISSDSGDSQILEYPLELTPYATNYIVQDIDTDSLDIYPYQKTTITFSEAYNGNMVEYPAYTGADGVTREHGNTRFTWYTNKYYTDEDGCPATCYTYSYSDGVNTRSFITSEDIEAPIESYCYIMPSYDYASYNISNAGLIIPTYIHASKYSYLTYIELNHVYWDGPETTEYNYFSITNQKSANNIGIQYTYDFDGTTFTTYANKDKYQVGNGVLPNIVAEFNTDNTTYYTYNRFDRLPSAYLDATKNHTFKIYACNPLTNEQIGETYTISYYFDVVSSRPYVDTKATISYVYAYKEYVRWSDCATIDFTNVQKELTVNAYMKGTTYIDEVGTKPYISTVNLTYVGYTYSGVNDDIPYNYKGKHMYDGTYTSFLLSKGTKYTVDFLEYEDPKTGYIFTANLYAQEITKTATKIYPAEITRLYFSYEESKNHTFNPELSTYYLDNISIHTEDYN